jgi:hypothetical protein
MKRTLNFYDIVTGYQGMVMVDKITYLRKSADGEITYIHLVNEVVLKTSDSINTLQARIDATD